VVFDGDLVQSGARDEFEAFDRIADRLDVPLFAVPGNHDLIGSGRSAEAQLTLPEFERRYAPAPLPYRVRVGGVDLVGLNSNASTHESLADSYEGRLESETLAWLDDVLDDADSPLVAVHHTLDPVRTFYRQGKRHLPIEDGGSPGFANGDDLVEALARNDAPLVLTGHLHVPAVARAGPVREFTLPPLGPFPCAYTVLEVDERGTTATYHAIADFDRRAEALGLGLDHDRVLLAGAQLADLPLVDEQSDAA
jgi:Icc protein